MIDPNLNTRIYAEFERQLQYSDISVSDFVREQGHENDEEIVLELISAATQAHAKKGKLTEPSKLVKDFPGLAEQSIQDAIKKSISTYVGVHCPASDNAGRLPVVHGRYRFIKELGRDYSGVVYETQEISTGLRTAVKVFFAFTGELDDKMQILRLVDHPGVPKTYEYGKIGSLDFIAREIIDGSVFRSYCRQPPRLSPKQVVSTIAKTLGIVSECHARGLIHWNLSPDTMMLRNGEPVVCDFGLDQHHGVVRLINCDSAYHAPELSNFPRNISPVHCDLYSIGVCLYEMLTGIPPKKPIGTEQVRRASDFQEGIDDALDAICERAVSNSPSSRFPSANSFKETLEAWLDRQGSTCEAIPNTNPDSHTVENKKSNKRRLTPSLVIIGSILLIGCAIIARWIW